MPAEPAPRGKKILIIGGGGREHALVWKLAQSPSVSAIYASPGSDAIARHARCVALTGNDAVADFAASEGIGLTVVGPEVPLVAGLIDAMTARGLRVFGPTRAAARLEGSKAFAKAFMQRHDIPTGGFAVYDRAADALAHIDEAALPLVVKADGLAAGKGVTICRDRDTAREAIVSAMEGRVFGDAGSQIVIEDFLPGEEASIFAISDGERFLTFPPAQDHKPLGDGDTGPNTGGMGAYCPAPVVTPAVQDRIVAEIIQPTLSGMAAEGHPYRGVLYVGLMIRDGAPYVVEYNCRFGDPECQPLLMMLESDLLEILEAALDGTLDSVRPRWRNGAATCIVMASEGYPGPYRSGLRIDGLENIVPTGDLQVFHAGTERDSGGWATRGGRVLGVTAWGESLKQAIERGYRAVDSIGWDGVIYRRDIGQKGLQ